MKPVPERYRLKQSKIPGLATDSTWGNNGMFLIPHWRIRNYELRCKVSDSTYMKDHVEDDKDLWEHISVTVAEIKKDATRCPTWAEMCYVKDLFFGNDEAVMQLHPPEREYVNNHPFCLHLWKPVGQEIPLPPSIYVGFKSKQGHQQ